MEYALIHKGLTVSQMSDDTSPKFFTKNSLVQGSK